uniref:protocadherin-9-like n=1 Tax=Myxine glutinosa TaxID=7769 RepID=UPI00358E8C69
MLQRGQTSRFLLPPFLLFVASLAEELKVSYRIAEELPKDTFIGNPSLDLRLSHYEQDLTYKLMASTAPDTTPPLVRVDSHTGELYTSAHKIDREALCPDAFADVDCSLNIQLGVLSVKPGPFFKLIDVRISVEDVNDNAPAFQKPVLTLAVPENAVAGKRFAIPPAIDPDRGSNSVRRYELLPPPDMATESAFELSVKENADGEKLPYLVVRQSLDREQRQKYEMRIRAEDGGSPLGSVTAVLMINVTDVNDNSPVFDQSEVSVEIPENSPVGTPVVRMHATDRDLGANAEVMYHFHGPGGTSALAAHRLFRMDPSSGLITVNGALDREKGSIYRLIVLATDKGPEPIPSTATVSVIVTDVNDNPPSIEIRDIVAPINGIIYISEAAHVNLPVALISVSDPDVSANGAVTCYINNADVPFQLKKLTYPNQYLLETKEPLDYETQNEYSVQVVAMDSGVPSLAKTASVTVRLTDVNDNAPVFTESLYEVSVPENNALGKHLVTLSATDRDTEQNADIIYSLGSDAPAMFLMDPSTGVITLTDILDREKNSHYKFTVVAKDQGVPSLEGNSTVVVNVLDVNDNRPHFSLAEFDFYVHENLPKHSTVGMVTVADADEGDNGRVRLSILKNDDRRHFSIDEDSGMIRSNVALDREQRHYYVIEVQASDTGEPVWSSTVQVVIHVMDMNDNAPTVLIPLSNSTYIFLPPSTPPGSKVADVMAVDNDVELNAQLRYGIVGGNPHGLFRINPIIGNITLIEPLARDHYGLHRLVVRVSDTGSSLQNHAVVMVHLFINDTLDNATYVELLILGSVQTPIETDVAGFGRRNQEDSKVLLIAAVLAGILGVFLIVPLGVLVHRCYYNRQKGGGGVIGRGKHGGQEWLSPTQENKYVSNCKNSKKGEKKKKKQANGAPFSIAIEATKNSDDPTYQTINEAMSWGHESDAPSPIYGLSSGGGDGVASTFKPTPSKSVGTGGAESPDLARHYRSTSPVTPVTLPATQQTPTGSKKYGVIQELPVANTFVGSGGAGSVAADCMSSKRSSISSEHCSHSENECISQSGGNGGAGNSKTLPRYPRPQPQRRVKFTLEGEYASAHPTCTDEGFGEGSDAMVSGLRAPPVVPGLASAASNGCYYQLTPLIDETHERSTPDGSIGESEHQEHAASATREVHSGGRVCIGASNLHRRRIW